MTEPAVVRASHGPLPTSAADQKGSDASVSAVSVNPQPDGYIRTARGPCRPRKWEQRRSSIDKVAACRQFPFLSQLDSIVPCAGP